MKSFVEGYTQYSADMTHDDMLFSILMIFFYLTTFIHSPFQRSQSFVFIVDVFSIIMDIFSLFSLRSFLLSFLS